MKIHLISNMYPDKNAPSYGVFIQNIETILMKASFEIDRTVLHKKNNKLEKIIHYLWYYTKIVTKILFRKYDVHYVHYAVHNSFPLLFVKKIKRNIKIYTNVHGSDVMPVVKSREKMQKYVKKLLDISDKVIVPSHNYKKLVMEKYQLKTPVHVFPSGGVNKQIFYEYEDKTEIYKDLELDASKKYIGFVGRLEHSKGWDIFLDSIHKLSLSGYMKGRKAIVVGSGKEYNLFLEKIDRYKLNAKIIHYPLLPQEQLTKIYNCLDVFCFPTRGESLGLVGLEAMACGVPVIGSKVGGLLDYIDDGINGLLFEVGNSDDLKEKLMTFFQYSDDERHKMKVCAKKKASNYETEKIKQNLINIFSDFPISKWTVK